MCCRGSQVQILGPLSGPGLSHSLLIEGVWPFPCSNGCWKSEASVLLLQNRQRLRQEVMKNLDGWALGALVDEAPCVRAGVLPSLWAANGAVA